MTIMPTMGRSRLWCVAAFLLIAVKNGVATDAPSPRPTPEPTAQPSPRPTPNPTASPSSAPTTSPSGAPSSAPTRAPTRNPTATPTRVPTRRPTNEPTPDPTRNPTRQPTNEPTPDPTRNPTREPTREPTRAPTRQPTREPTREPTRSPTRMPTRTPTATPTRAPTKNPTASPSEAPSVTQFTNDVQIYLSVPSQTPTAAVEASVTAALLGELTGSTTLAPTRSPTARPTRNPTNNPTKSPTQSPTKTPTKNPTQEPTRNPTANPTRNPTRNPTQEPTANPTRTPTRRPTNDPTPNPTRRPTPNPTNSRRDLQDTTLPKKCTATTEGTSDAVCNSLGLGSFSYECGGDLGGFACCTKGFGAQIKGGLCTRNNGNNSGGNTGGNSGGNDGVTVEIPEGTFNPEVDSFTVDAIPVSCDVFATSVPPGDQCMLVLVEFSGPSQANLVVYEVEVLNSVADESFATALQAEGLSATASVPGEPAAATAAPTIAPTECQSIFDLACNFEGDFNILCSLIQTAGLTDTLSSELDLTVFAPTDAAFQIALQAGITDDPEALTDLLLYHTISGSVLPTSAIDCEATPLLQVMGNGDPAGIICEADDIFVVGPGNEQIGLDPAVIVSADIDACNGIVHIIDGLIIPDLETEEPTTEEPTGSPTTTDTCPEFTDDCEGCVAVEGCVFCLGSGECFNAVRAQKGVDSDLSKRFLQPEADVCGAVTSLAEACPAPPTEPPTLAPTLAPTASAYSVSWRYTTAILLGAVSSIFMCLV